MAFCQTGEDDRILKIYTEAAARIPLPIIIIFCDCGDARGGGIKKMELSQMTRRVKEED